MTIWMLWAFGVSVLVAISASLLARVAGYVGAPRRYVWIGAIVIATGAPLLLPAHRTPAPWRLPSSAHSFTAPSRVPLTSPSVGAASTSPRVSSNSNLQTLISRTDAWLSVAWAVWSCALLISLAQIIAALQRRSASWHEADSEVGSVLVATEDGPAVIGWIRPRIVVPAWVFDADPQTRSLILRHESEHVWARDTRLLLLAEVVRRLFPWNAALWWMANRVRLSIELDCDARVIRASGAAHAYGIMLLTVSERFAHDLPLAVSPLASRYDLEHRLEVLAAKRRRRPIVASIPYASLALAILATVAWTPRPGFPLVARASTATVDSDLVRVGYVKRKEGGRGFFVDGAAIDRRSPLFSDALRELPGLRVSPSGDGHTNVITSGRPDVDCVDMYVDGVRWQTTTPGDIDQSVSSTQLIAVEMYQPPDAPSQFARPDQRPCTSLIVWTQAIHRKR